jgi:hypothetical protein
VAMTAHIHPDQLQARHWLSPMDPLRSTALAAQRRRFGYRRQAWMLERERTIVNLRRVYRLYREEGLAGLFRSPGGYPSAPPCRVEARRLLLQLLLPREN